MNADFQDKTRDSCVVSTVVFQVDNSLMTDRDCVQFLKWSLPQLHMRWNGFRKVRGQVCKRIDRRLHELGLADAAAYRSFLERSGSEWEALDALCRVTISRFYRDRDVFQSLEQEVLVRLCENAMVHGETEIRCWSIGCASGEEPYTLAILWDLGTGPRFPSLKISILATDADGLLIERAKEGCYTSGSLGNLPKDWRNWTFVRNQDTFCIRAEEREKVSFFEQDLRAAEPDGKFHLILCRNLAFTYFEKELQKDIQVRLYNKLHDQGALVLGIHEELPPDNAWFIRWPGSRAIYIKK